MLEWVIFIHVFFMKATVAVLFFALFLAACGQKGALYLPKTTDKPADEPVISQNPNDY